MVVTMSGFSMITDLSRSPAAITVRIAVGSASLTLGRVVGSLLTAQILSMTNNSYVFVFLASEVFDCAAFFYGIFMVYETVNLSGSAEHRETVEEPPTEDLNDNPRDDTATPLPRPNTQIVVRQVEEVVHGEEGEEPETGDSNAVLGEYSISEPRKCGWIAFGMQEMANAVGVIFRPREGHKRTYLVLGLLLFSVIIAGDFGELSHVLLLLSQELIYTIFEAKNGGYP